MRCEKKISKNLLVITEVCYNLTMDILNYQGNKTKLLSFIDENISPLLSKDKALLDIFSGGASVSAFFSKRHIVMSNDLEPYAYHIANSIICSNRFKDFDKAFFTKFERDFSTNYYFIKEKIGNLIDEEEKSLARDERLCSFYESVPTLWNNMFSPILNQKITNETVLKRGFRYCLFTLLYSSNYFGVKQAAQIDSIICAIESSNDDYNKSLLYSSLFYSMNKCVFSKDGHMAQPLNISKNLSRCVRCRSKSIIDIFYESLRAHQSSKLYSKNNKAFNLEFEELLRKINPSEICCIYADPPYTDMQYSRYYHLLNIACEYEFAYPTMKGETHSSGLYLNNRRQSGISVRSTFLEKMKKLCVFARTNGINLVISFGYPGKDSEEKNDRYLCSITDLKLMAESVFGVKNVTLIGQNYEHANQRNSKQKKVIEYLVVCRGGNDD